jgi:hypothetical protein
LPTSKQIEEAVPHAEDLGWRLLVGGSHAWADSLGDAIGSAVKDVMRAGYTVARVEVAASS